LVSGVSAFGTGDEVTRESGGDPDKELAEISHPCADNLLDQFSVMPERENKIISSQAKKPKAKAKEFTVANLPRHLRHINVNAGGIDIGSDRHLVAVPEGRDVVSVREFKAFTADLHALADWLSQCGVTTVAMESTGVYWIPLYEILEQRGFEVYLVDARRVKNVSGRKSDVLDCQWTQELHTYGLLVQAFRPPEEVCVLRSYLRQKEMLVQAAAEHIQHMQKALQQMNLLLHNVVSDITGVTGLNILKAIIAGERNAQVLAALRDRRCQNSAETIAKSLVGNYREEHLFALRQALELYEFYQVKIADCETAIAAYLLRQEHHTDDQPPAPQKPIPARNRLRAGVDVRDQLYKMSGVDLFRVSGLAADTLLTLAGEVGFDMTPWKSVKHFSSWLALCPDNDISGGRVLWRGMRRVQNRAGHLFRLAAHSLHHDQTPMGDYLRRMKSKLGPVGATTATAHKIAIIFYTMIKKQVEYDATIWAERDAEREKRFEAKLRRQAQQRGYKLVPIEENPARVSA